jgi:tetratricopeptide (TPR) repeat protein
MLLSANDLIEKSKDQRNRKRFKEALVSALAAIEKDPDNPNAWWQMSISSLDIADKKNAIFALRKTVELAPQADIAWSYLGEILLEDGNHYEAREALQEALDWNEYNEKALQGMAQIYVKEDDKEQDDEEISVLDRIEIISHFDVMQLNRLGILHYRNGRYHESIKYWSRDIASASDPSRRYNLGLAYIQPKISQKADAIDMWHMTLNQWSGHEPTKNMLSKTLPRLLELSKKVRREVDTVLPREQWYENYLNPFELINPPDYLDFDDFDIKRLQKLKKALLQEIELENGVVAWMQCIIIDKSRAIGLCDELNNDVKRRFHWMVYQNKPLLKFLTKGCHEHFLVNAECSILKTIEYLECEENGFCEWLGNLFAPQFDKLLNKTIQAENLIILECLLNGRRWIPASHIDQCFLNTRRTIDRIIQPLREANERADDHKPSVREIERILNCGSLLRILNLLPTFFEDFQRTAIDSIRGIAVSSFNSHNDIDLSRQIIELAKQFRFPSADLNRAIQEDIEQIEKLIAQERANELKLIMGGKRVEITKEGIRFGDDRFISVADIAIARWGILITSINYVQEYDFILTAGANDGRRIVFNWKASNAIEEQEKYFQNMIIAFVEYLLPDLIDRTVNRIVSGLTLTIGPCRLTKHGIQYETTGWVFTNFHFVSWRHIQISIKNGDMIVHDINYQKKSTSFSLRDTDNAPLLKTLVNIMKGRNE